MVSTSDASLFVATEEKSPNLLYHKVCLTGAYGVGKTTLFLRLARGFFVDTVQSTLKSDAHKITHEVNGTEVPIIVHDTSGYEKVSTLTQTYFRGAVVVLLLFSVDDFVTLHQLEAQAEEARKFTHTKCCFTLVANKADLLMEFDEARVDDFKERLGCQSVFYISAKTGTNVNKLMDDVALSISQHEMSRRDTLQLLPEPGNSIVIRKTEKKRFRC